MTHAASDKGRGLSCVKFIWMSGADLPARKSSCRALIQMQTFPQHVPNPLPSSCQLHQSCRNRNPWKVFNISKKMEQLMACIPASLEQPLDKLFSDLALEVRVLLCWINNLPVCLCSFVDHDQGWPLQAFYAFGSTKAICLSFFFPGSPHKHWMNTFLMQMEKPADNWVWCGHSLSPAGSDRWITQAQCEKCSQEDPAASHW